MLESGKMIDAVCNQPGEIKTCFNLPEEIKYGFKDTQYLGQTIINKEEEIQLVLQVQSKMNRNKKFTGFQPADEQILKIVAFYLQMRLERRHALKEVRKREQQVVDTLQLTSEICTQRHHEGLFRKMRETLPAFFGFEAVGVLMFDFEQNFFFTDQDLSKDEQKSHRDDDSNDDLDENEEGDLHGDDQSQSLNSDLNTPLTLNKAMTKKKTKKKKEKPINYDKEDENLTEEQKKEKIRQIHAKKFMNFPTNSGISGAVFKSKALYISNTASKETKFVEEIDNQSVCTDVRNFMIGPVFGTQNSEVPCAIIQFINKVPTSDKGPEGKLINHNDEAKFKQMQNLLGMCVENTNEMSRTINVSFSVQDKMKNIQEMMRQENERELNDNTDQVIADLFNALQVMETNRKKLTELRKTNV